MCIRDRLQPYLVLSYNTRAFEKHLLFNLHLNFFDWDLSSSWAWLDYGLTWLKYRDHAMADIQALQTQLAELRTTLQVQAQALQKSLPSSNLYLVTPAPVLSVSSAAFAPTRTQTPQCSVPKKDLFCDSCGGRHERRTCKHRHAVCYNRPPRCL